MITSILWHICPSLSHCILFKSKFGSWHYGNALKLNSFPSVLLLDHSYTIDEAAGWSLAASRCLTWQTLQTLHPRMNPLHFHVNERVTAAAKPKGICDDHRYAAQICAWHGSDTLCDKETVSVLFQRASQRALGESGWHNNNVHHQSKTNACTLGPLPWTALRTTHIVVDISV